MGGLAKLGKAVAVVLVPVGAFVLASAVAGETGAAVVAVALFGLVGLGLLAASIGRLGAWLRLRGSAATDPGGVDPGPVEVEGTARPLSETVAPPRADDGAETLVYEHVIKKKRHDDDGGSRFETTKNETESVSFVVEGTGGEVVVDPDGADLLLENAYEERRSARREYVRRLDPGETVFVAGEAVHATAYDGPTDGRQYAVERPSTRTPEVLRRLYDDPFVVSDTSEAAAERRLLWNGVKLSGVALLYNALFVGILVAVVGGL